MEQGWAGAARLPAPALSTSKEPAWSHWLLEEEHKSFKAAKIFFFLFWVKKMDFFCKSLQCHWYGETGADAVCAPQTPPCTAERKLAAFPCLALVYSYFSLCLVLLAEFGVCQDDV